jgi:phytoene desaturase
MKLKNKKKIIIVGAGLGGLSASIYAIKKGFDVTVIEQQEKPGGKANLLEIKTKKGVFKFDTGPSLLTMPEVFQDLGLDLQKDLSLVSLNESARYFFSQSTSSKNVIKKQINNGKNTKNEIKTINFEHSTKQRTQENNLQKPFIAYTNQAKFEQEFKTFFKEDFKNWQRFKAKVKLIWDKGAKIFLYHKLDLKLLEKKIFWQNLIFLPFISVFISLDKLAKKYFKDQRIVKIINRLGTYNGSNPYKMPGTFACISQPEFFEDLYLPKNGIYEIPNKIYQQALKMGVKFKFNQNLEKIFLNQNQINKIIVKNKIDNKNTQYSNFDYILVNFDPLTFYDKFLSQDQKKPYKKLYKQTKSTSGIVFYWAIENLQENILGLHNIIFSQNYKQEFEEIFKQQKIPADPTIYINISSKVLENQAPKNCQNWFVMVNVPSTLDTDYKKETFILKQKIIKKIKNELALDIQDKILAEEILTPQTLFKKTGSHEGSLYGFDSNSIFRILNRPNFRDRKIKNLYFCGGSTHPGGGMPLAVLSGKLAVQELDKLNQENQKLL